jgi:segregation and condensation protein A
MLLDIVLRNQLDIATLPLAPIAAQYLAYIKQAEALDLNLGIEWADMAARLIRWKSAALLPSDPALPSAERTLAEELRRELLRLDQQRLASDAQFLAERRHIAESSFAHPSVDGYRDPPPPDPAEFASLWSLRKKAQTLRDLFRQRRDHPEPVYEAETDAVTVVEMIDWARRRLTELEPKAWVSAKPWFEEMATLGRKICLFLAVLEVARNSEVKLEDALESDAFWLQPQSVSRFVSSS